MSKRILTVAAADPHDLRGFVAARLAVSPRQAARLVAEGSVWVDGRRPSATDRTPLHTGQRITAYLEEAAARPAKVALPTVFSDEHLLVVDKPAGLPSQPGRRGGPSLLSLLPRGLFLVHRLDAEASGLLLCARTATAAATLQRALERGAITREYLAIVAGRLPESGRIELRIGPRACSGPMSALRQCYPVGSPHGQPATTLFRVADRRGAGAAEQTLLLVRLLSGRTHQIRVHLAALGSPILGDLAYGEPGPPAPRLMLHAARLRFPHPRTGRPCEILSPPPPELAWPPELVLAEASNAPAAPGASDAPITDAKTSRRDAGTRYSTLAAALDAAFPLAARSPTAAPHLAP